MKAPKSHAYNNLSGLVRDIFSTSEMHEGIVSGISLRITKATIIACTAGFALSATVAVAQDSPLTENPFINSQLEGGTELFSTVTAGAERTPIPTRVSINQTLQNLIDGTQIVDDSNQDEFEFRVKFAHAFDASPSFPDLNAVTFFGNSDNVLETGVSGGDAGTSFTRDSVIVIDDNVALSSEGNPISVFALTISNERLLGGELRGSSFLGIIETYVNADGNVSVGINSNDPGNPINLIGNIPLEVAGDAGEGVRVFFEGSDPTIVDSGNLAVRLELVRIIPEPTTAGFLGIGVLAILRRRRAAR